MELSILDECISFDFLYSESYDNFCKNLDGIKNILDDELYIEKVKNNNENIIKKNSKGLSKGIKRTVDTTKDLAATHSYATRTGGDVINGIWNIITSLLRMAVKSISFIVSKIMIIPDLILKLINNIEKIPQKIKNKIKGSIELYICAEDISVFYNKHLLRLTFQFISYANDLADGDMWSTFFNRKGYNKNTNKLSNKLYELTTTDMKLCKNMRSVHEKLKKITFEKSIIDMNDEKTVDIYFGGAKSVKFYDLSGKLHESTYYEALIQLIKDLQGEMKAIEHIRDIIGDKIDRTTVNQELGRLSQSAQETISDTISMVSSVIGIIGNIIRYIMADAKTINNSSNKILETMKIRPDNKAIKSAENENRNARKNKGI